MLTSELDYELPPGLIAQKPARQRDKSRLLVLYRPSGELEHRIFADLPRFLHPGDVLVLNQSRVIPARILGTVVETGKAAEILLVRRLEPGRWIAMVKPGRILKVGVKVTLADGLTAEMAGILPDGMRVVEFYGADSVDETLLDIGQTPLPPYIERKKGELEIDRERYQTVYARHDGSVAAPTAGLHFTPELLDTLRKSGIKVINITCHIGPGTFRPVTAKVLEEHRMDEEHFTVSAQAARAINNARLKGGRIAAVGTSAVRTLESCAAADGTIVAQSGRTELFITPGYKFKAVDVLLTNFHLPHSTTLSLAAAFAGRELLLAAYAEAIRRKYRFYSFGDAMLIV
jgi:S-adenosylmethionine:tRNA ribosyltransferase-isomerase